MYYSKKTTSIVFIFLFFSTVLSAQDKYTIVIHGGAGNINKEMPDSVKQNYYNSLKEALVIGKSILHGGGSSLDAVEKVINYLEDNPLFNAGKGAVYTAEGKHELDASIMNGKDLSCGAVAGVTTIKNPISLARLVMEKSQHVLFFGDGAEQFGKKMGVAFVNNSFFDTEERFEQLKKAEEKIKGTVGCVAIDKNGNIAAGTSTGGMTNKMHGRIGDSPIIGAGNYANNTTCGVSATGTGELFIRNNVAFNISALMEYKGFTLQQAAEEMINKRLPKGAGGIIAVDKNGNYSFVFSTTGMFRAAANSNGVFEVKYGMIN
ncbi:MAG: isoaspartyl peptidase/L-asparaginase, partial [Ignavibacteriaceae bacterium]|nr:isoaspartyl peptidase/L-asparaginase [Ignavibacteriaceae bacterium]